MKKDFKEFLLKKQFNDKIDSDIWHIILETEDFNFIWEHLLGLDLEKNYNFVVTVKIVEKFFKYDEIFSEIEKRVYNKKTEFEIFFLMIKTLEKVLSSNFNEMIKRDLDIIGRNDIWSAMSLDSLYFMKLSHLDFSKQTSVKKNPELYEINLTINIIVTTLERLSGCYFYTRLKKDETYPIELLSSISFTKGYLICFDPNLSVILKNYKYCRKNVLKEPLIIRNFKKIKFIDTLTNTYLVNSIWLNNNNLSITNYSKSNIYNKKLLEKKTNFKICISTINFLNSIKLSYNDKIFNNIYDIISKKENMHNTLSNINSLKNIVLQINNNVNEFTEIKSDLTSSIQGASIIELIKTQLETYSSFYLNYRLDHRLRIYCYPWPINYQLNHVVRNAICFVNKKIKIIDILENFYKHPLIIKYNKDRTILTYKEDYEIHNKINLFFDEKFLYDLNDSDEVTDLKKECFYQTMIKYNKGGVKEKFFKNIDLINDFIKADIVEECDFWLEKFKIKKKKIPYLVSFHKTICDIISNKWSGVFWADASSNAIQLIIFRLGIRDRLLLKLVNIIDNDTNFSNIYEYLCNSIKNMDHGELLEKVSNLSHEELISFQDIDLNKYLLMPSAYGMGKISYRENVDVMLNSDERKEIWDKLTNNDKNKISDHFWDCAVKVLKTLSFDMEEYKEMCKVFWEETDYEGFLWRNDLGLTIGPISLVKSKRDQILKKLNELKLKKKENLSNQREISLDEKIKKLKEKLKKDDKDFWKRASIKGRDIKIFSRIYFKKKYNIQKHETRQALIPNTIHAYDACNIHLCLQICKKLNIEILVIHDSIGCEPLLLPLVKTIFKVVNILFIDLNSKKRKVFPLHIQKKNKILFKDLAEKEDLEKLFEEILKSKNFFR